MAKTWLSRGRISTSASPASTPPGPRWSCSRSADCVIAIGAGLNKYTTEHGYLYPDATFIQIDTKPHVVMGDGRSARTSSCTRDAVSASSELHEALQERSVRQVGYRTPDVKERLATAFDDNEPYEIEPGTVDPRDVCRVLDEPIPPEIGLVIGGGQNICFSTILMTRQRRMVLANQHFGCIGQGLTTAMGAWSARPAEPAGLPDGGRRRLHDAPARVRDGSALRHCRCWSSFMNDQLLGAEYHKAVAKGGSTPIWPGSSTPDLGCGRPGARRDGALVTDARRAARPRSTSTSPIPRRPSSTCGSPRRHQHPLPRLHFGQDA